MITTFERGKLEGRLEEKLENRREIVLLQLETQFGPLSPEVQQRVLEMDLDQLLQLLVDIVKFFSLKELHLED